jgi:hypothetical protein
MGMSRERAIYIHAALRECVFFFSARTVIDARMCLEKALDAMQQQQQQQQRQ